MWLNIGKLSILQILIYMCNPVPIKILPSFFIDIKAKMYLEKSDCRTANNLY